MAEGLSGFTHLFNAMRPLSAREPGPIAAALESPSCWYGLIADGMHVAPPMLQLAMRGAGNPMLVTDAMPPVGGVRSSFMLQGKRIETRDGRCTTAGGVLAGSGLDMASAVRNCVRLAGIPLPVALRFASLMPARFLGVDDRLGQLVRNFRADMVALDPNAIRVTATWVAGNYAQSATSY
jgi:N-acetylglucosamine-6-phosphate deacetylase